jgi:hypothetical protein
MEKGIQRTHQTNHAETTEAASEQLTSEVTELPEEATDTRTCEQQMAIDAEQITNKRDDIQHQQTPPP